MMFAWPGGEPLPAKTACGVIRGPWPGSRAGRRGAGAPDYRLGDKVTFAGKHPED